jgi:hypothetical protein
MLHPNNLLYLLGDIPNKSNSVYLSKPVCFDTSRGGKSCKVLCRLWLTSWRHTSDCLKPHFYYLK